VVKENEEINSLTINLGVYNTTSLTVEDGFCKSCNCQERPQESCQSNWLFVYILVKRRENGCPPNVVIG
jgi:hypothetical protein